MLKSVICLIQAFLFFISSLSAVDSYSKFNNERKAILINSTSDFTFDAISADDMKVSESEKAECREWYNENILTTSSPAYDFTVKNKSLQENIKDWSIEVGKESAVNEVRQGGKTTYITLRHRKSSLIATVEATIYEDDATCEWTIYIKNTGNENSPVIKNFYAVNTKLELKNCDLYVSKGSRPANDDFELLKTELGSLPLSFSANGGRTESFLPYYNLNGKETSAVISVGWTGQWATKIKQNKNNLLFQAKQETLRAYLEPQEEIRSPLVTVTFYNNDNALKGFNTYRNWELNCVYPESFEPKMGFVIANEFNTKTTDELIEQVNNINPDIMKDVDYFWMDAGWYEYTEAWHDGVGNWTPDKSRFPDGLKPLTDAMKEKGAGLLLWFEPERVRENTYLYNEGLKHEGWTVQQGDNILWNLGNDDACDFLIETIVKAMVDNGISYYRQDFNFTPLSYWEEADEKFCDNRKGITENHYVTNEYRYLDSLLEAVPGLMIDNCASGGKRLDIEMTRRSVPLWRSDYNCGTADGKIKEDVLEATQTMTYGLSFWLPYSGTNRYFHSEYASRSAILTHSSVYEPTVDEFAKYKDIQNLMAENYYPLTYGGLDTDKYLAMQFGNENVGAAMIYKRENVADGTYKLFLNGLDENADYTLTSIDNDMKAVTKTGKELMNNGLTVFVKDTPKCEIIKYTKS